MIQRIVAPTDFSLVADNAVDYAVGLAEKMDCPVNLIHYTHAGMSSTSPCSFSEYGDKLLEVKSQLFQLALDKCMPGISIEPQLKVGFAQSSLTTLSEEYSAQYIVMGMNGAAMASEKLLGTTSRYISQNALCPVWLIPPKTTFNEIKNILFVFDFKTDTFPRVQKIKSLIAPFDAKLHLVHIEKGDQRFGKYYEEQFIHDYFAPIAKKREISLSSIKQENVMEGIDESVKEKDIDLVIFATQQRGIREKMFQQCANLAVQYPNNVPVLVVHLDN